ncbi:MAG: hypothetical protein IKQ46_03540 [Bacteroidales bacterium]|nr:hypothetical protein [Bacteroidales bacterium]
MKQNSNFQHIIVVDKKYPFFQKYNDESYIISQDCRSVVTVSEQRMKYILNNPANKEIVVYKIDQGIIKGTQWKCDFGIYTQDDILFLIELKSPESEYYHALEQIINTIELLIKSCDVSVKKLNARVVTRKYPDILSAKERKLENRLIRDYKCNLQHGRVVFTESL